MSGTTNNGRMPRLRFPEFRGAGEWVQTTLGAVARLKNGYAFKSSDYVDSGSFQIVTIANVQQGSMTLDAAKRITQPPADIQKHQKLCIGDILISMTGNVGRVCRVACGSLLQNQRVGKLVPVDIHPKFFYHSLQREDFRNSMQLKAAGGAQGNLSSGDIIDYTLDYPADDAEQQKIADCLSSLDDLITLEAQKLEALKAHKKGLMQQLFPREGETQPRLRFPEFQDAGDWEETSLGTYFDPIRNGFVGTATPYYTTSEGVRYLQGRNIKQGVIERDNLIFITSEFHNRQRKSHLNANDILMVQSGHVGECAVVGSSFSGCNCHALIILTPKRKLSSDFFVHYFYSPIGELSIFQITTGNTIKHILASELKTLPVLVPNKDEQTRIASCLTSLNDLITVQTQKLEALKIHKKGFMQQLFPQVSEE